MFVCLNSNQRVYLSEGQRGFEAWHLIVRRYDQRNTSDRSSAYAALISKQFDDILRTFTNEMTKFENRFG